MHREKVRFASGGSEIAGWHYPGTNGACVIMAGGSAVTKEPGTDRFAQRFQAAGFAVLAFDYRHLGESGGQPRQVVRVREQLADWRAAMGFAATLPGGHYAPFLDGYEQAVAAELSFLRRHLLEPARADRPGVIPMIPARPGGGRA
jgi:alpha-beta hydrolase superfamily lysophospholipase